MMSSRSANSSSTSCPCAAPIGRLCFAPMTGGAPGNVAVGVARLGDRAAMLSKVGDDTFGRLLIATLAGLRGSD